MWLWRSTAAAGGQRGPGIEAHGVDFSSVALRVGRRAAGAGPLLATADGEALPYPESCFDRVTSIGSLEHYHDPLEGASELARVLRPDGVAAVLLPNSFGLRWNVMHTWRHGDVHDDGQPLQRYATRRQWARLLAAGGLDAMRVVGYEGDGGGLASLPGMLRHPSRALVPLGRWLPLNMASMFIFLCRRRPTR